ncbi:MAG: ribonucleoside triphosphate reductase [Chitinispirillales bacterium]|jgi:ribonucleoside-triphosphate reductase|nr:ribonucleoside triphosphate reductase [Chitinispirillales bacterium]
MIRTVRRRDGTFVAYDRQKIANAIWGALQATGGADLQLAQILAEKAEKEIGEKFSENLIPAVEDIQDIVEDVLMNNGYNHVARAYISYRNQHMKRRNAKKLTLDIKETFDGYLKNTNWRVKENSNVNYSIGGLILHISGEMTTNYWLDEIYTDKIAKYHREGRFHIHDLQMFSGYCAGWSLRDLIREGLGGVEGKIASAPAKHLYTIVQQMVNFLGCLQNEWAGAQAFSSVDTFLAPFVWVDNLSYEQVKQAIQSFVFDVNIPSRWGSQAPFTNVTFDWVCPNDLKDRAAEVGGKALEKKYGDFQKEMDMINRAFLEVFLEGDANKRGFMYPIPTYNITKEFNWNSDNAKLLWEMTGKYGTPYFQNFINSSLKPEDVRSMCCRLQLSLKELNKRGGGQFGSAEMTGSVGVVTINLPKIGYLTQGNKKAFFNSLDECMDVAKESLEIKRGTVLQLINEGFFPYTKRYLRDLKGREITNKETGKKIKLNELSNHFSTIGIVGMNEACTNFMGKNILNEEAREFAKEVLNHMRDRLVIYQEETGNFYNLEATPCEGTSHRLAGIDRELYLEMEIPGGENPYYTNSTQLPVEATDDIFEALNMQDELQTLYTGGTVIHGFIGEAIEDTSAVSGLVKKIASRYKLPYFTISPTYSVCSTHGYLTGEQTKCHCGKDTEVYSRIVGYYRPVKNWNKGKRAEYDNRKLYKSKTANFSLPECKEAVQMETVLA